MATDQKVSMELVQQVFEEILGVDSRQVVPEARIIEDLGADSLDHVELLMAFEERLGIEVQDQEVEKITTVGELIEFLKEKVEVVQ